MLPCIQEATSSAKSFMHWHDNDNLLTKSRGAAQGLWSSFAPIRRILRDMYNNKEASSYNFAVNRNCPEDLMWEIFNSNDSIISHPGLAMNPNIPVDMILKLEGSQDRAVMASLRSNPKYKAIQKRRNE